MIMCWLSFLFFVFLYTLVPRGCWEYGRGSNLIFPWLFFGDPVEERRNPPNLQFIVITTSQVCFFLVNSSLSLGDPKALHGRTQQRTDSSIFVCFMGLIFAHGSSLTSTPTPARDPRGLRGVPRSLGARAPPRWPARERP